MAKKRVAVEGVAGEDKENIDIDLVRAFGV